MEAAAAVVSTIGVAGAERTAVGAPSRAGHATTDLRRFTWLLAQLGVLFSVFRLYRLEETSFVLLSAMVFGGFAVHYWIPYRFKEWFWILMSMAGAFLLVEPVSASLIILAGFILFACLHNGLAYRVRVLILVVACGLMVYGRATLSFGIPPEFWPVFGAIFMFRTIVYVYDIRHMPARPTVRDFMSYFFILPNYYFLLFPVVDYQTLRRSYYQRDIHVVAQQGITWIARGTVHLLLYRAIYHLKGPSNAPDQITSFGALVATMVLTYLLYLRVSGQFHIIVGMLHLFGYDLPETHRRYLLASSLTDFWRRINIYWKDFMVKVIYFPIYFKIRRLGETKAQVIATGSVFIATWFLHSYQWFWLRGQWLFTWPDLLFWAILGGLVIVNVLHEANTRKNQPSRLAPGPVRKALRIAATFGFMTILWSFWNTPSLTEWLDVVTWWQIG